MKDEFRAGGVGYGHFKQRLFEAIWEYYAPMRTRREEILSKPGYVDEVLAEGARRAAAIAEPTVERVWKAVGLR
jgi:tryptophanyl-tRNA synthetase